MAVCGGRLCVQLEVQPADADPESCGFARTEPSAGTTVQRDSTVVLVCNPRPTDPGETDPSGGTTPPDDTSPPDDTTPPDDTQTPSS